MQPVRTCAHHTYWGGVDFEEGELHTLEDAMVGIWPTNDEQAVIYTGYPRQNSPRRSEETWEVGFGRLWKFIPGSG